MSSWQMSGGPQPPRWWSGSGALWAAGPAAAAVRFGGQPLDEVVDGGGVLGRYPQRGDSADLGGLTDDGLGRAGLHGERRRLPTGDHEAGDGGVGVEVGQVVLVEFGQGVPAEDAGVLRRHGEI